MDREDAELLVELERTGVFDGLRWANRAATRRTLDDYSELTGHDAGWLGYTRFTLLRDRTDRFASCGKYDIESDEYIDQGLDLVYAELTQQEIAEMPHLPTDLVRRADLNGSPGWRFGDVRLLLASCTYGKIDTLPWPQKSWTKQEVARRPHIDPQMTLFEDMPEEELRGLLALREGVQDLTTLVVAHALDPIRQRSELVIGRPQFNRGGGNAWYWSHDLLSDPPDSGGFRTRPTTPSPSPTDVPDAPVQLRRRAIEESGTA